MRSRTELMRRAEEGLDQEKRWRRSKEKKEEEQYEFMHTYPRILEEDLESLRSTSKMCVRGDVATPDRGHLLISYVLTTTLIRT